MHLRQIGIRVVVTVMLRVPLCLFLLLHDIVPGIDVVFTELIKQIERRAGQSQHFGARFAQLFYDIIAQFGLCAFMGFVNDDKIPVQVKYRVVFIEFPADTFGAAQILNRCKIEEIGAVFIKPFDFQIVFKVDLFIVGISGVVGFQFKGIIMLGRARIKDFCKIRAPSVTDDRTMRNNDHAAILRTAHDFKGCQRFAKTHFGIPQHFVLFFERFDGLFDRCLLLITEIDFCNRLPVRGFLGCGKRGLALLYGEDRSNCHINRRGKPFLARCSVRLNLMNAGIHQNLVDILVLESE